MDNAKGRHRSRLSSIVVMVGLIVGTLTVQPPSVGAVANTCRARNVTQGTPTNSNLQAVIKAASPGDRIAVKNVCVGNFKIRKALTLLGRATPDTPRPILTAHGDGRPLVVRAQVKLVNLKITGGDVPLGTGGCPTSCGGGIANMGILTLKNTVVRGNKVASGGGGGGGIYNAYTATLTLNGSSSVWGNDSTDSVAGGILNLGGTVTLNGTSSVRGNTGGEGGGIDTYEPGSVTLNDSSSITGNSAIADGGGININFNSPVTLNDSASVTGNTADADDFGGGQGGGVFVWCGGVLNGAVDGGNVNDNFRGVAAPVEDNISYQC